MSQNLMSPLVIAGPITVSGNFKYSEQMLIRSGDKNNSTIQFRLIANRHIVEDTSLPAKMLFNVGSIYTNLPLLFPN